MKNPFRGASAPDFKRLIDNSLAAASRAAGKEKIKERATEVARQKEGIRIKVVGSLTCNTLKSASRSFGDVGSFPRRALGTGAISDIAGIYGELADVLYGTAKLAECQASLVRSANRIKEMQMYYLHYLKKARRTNEMRRIRKEFYGRVTGLLKQIRKKIQFLRDASATLSRLPDFEEAPTAIIAGLPNVGKTSLLTAITGSDPEIAEYPFTTKGLMLGFASLSGKRVQFVDTPGLLDRPLEKRNRIERQTITALVRLADVVIYVWDPSETAGYSMEQQARQLDEIRNFFEKPVIEVANKSDLIGIHEAPRGSIRVSAKDGTGISALRSALLDKIKI